MAPALPRPVVVRKIDPHGEETARYHGVVVQEDSEGVVLEASWERNRMDLGYVVLEPGDAFIEHFYRHKWYNVFEIYRAADGRFRGWYCNVTRPPRITSSEVTWYDLALDLFVGPDGRAKALDEDEFKALALRTSDSQVWRQAKLAWEELRGIAERHKLPFSGTGSHSVRDAKPASPGVS